jgi:hypothetical protein
MVEIKENIENLLHQTIERVHDYKIHDDGSVDINPNYPYNRVIMRVKNNITKLPIKLNVVNGSMDGRFSSLTTMEGFPEIISRSLYMTRCELTSLDFCPNVKLNLDFEGILLRSITGIPSNSVLDTLKLSWHSKLPLLSLLRLNVAFLFLFDQSGQHLSEKILRQYMNVPNKRKAIIDCQKELIDAGFIGNAGW